MVQEVKIAFLGFTLALLLSAYFLKNHFVTGFCAAFDLMCIFIFIINKRSKILNKEKQTKIIEPKWIEPLPIKNEEIIISEEVIENGKQQTNQV